MENKILIFFKNWFQILFENGAIILKNNLMSLYKNKIIFGLVIVIAIILIMIIFDSNFSYSPEPPKHNSDKLAFEEGIFVKVSGWLILATLAATITGFIIALSSLVSLEASTKENTRIKEEFKQSSTDLEKKFEKIAQDLKREIEVEKQGIKQDILVNTRYQKRTYISEAFQKTLPDLNLSNPEESVRVFYNNQIQNINLVSLLANLDSQDIEFLKKNLSLIAQEVRVRMELTEYLHLAFEHGLFDEKRLGKRAYEVEELYKQIVKDWQSI